MTFALSFNPLQNRWSARFEGYAEPIAYGQTQDEAVTALLAISAELSGEMTEDGSTPSEGPITPDYGHPNS